MPKSSRRRTRPRTAAEEAADLRRLLPPFLLLTAIFFLGGVGYYIIGWYGHATGRLSEPWPLYECFFMTAISLTTVGYGDWLGVRGFRAAELYTIGVLVAGMGGVLYGVSELTSYFVEGHLLHLMERRRRMKKIERLKDHAILAGGGDTGVGVMRELTSTKTPFVLIDSDAEECAKLREEFPEALILEGDATEDDMLLRAGIERARGLIACLPSDKDNLFLAITARNLNPNLRIVARALAENMEEKLRAVGVDRVVSTSFTGGLRLASELIRPQVVTFLDRMIRESEDFRFCEVQIQPGSEVDGVHLLKSGIRSKTGVNVIAIRDASGRYHYNMDIERELRSGDILFGIGNPEMVRKLRMICGVPPEGEIS
ncbi:MAG: potassium channel protein [Candidatus Hydrogenedentota bacterium]|nr:MAG: potassium channel protein [Candidatus Hydrogenedentota bacterium]